MFVENINSKIIIITRDIMRESEIDNMLHNMYTPFISRVSSSENLVNTLTKNKDIRRNATDSGNLSLQHRRCHANLEDSSMFFPRKYNGAAAIEVRSTRALLKHSK